MSRGMFESVEYPLTGLMDGPLTGFLTERARVHISLTIDIVLVALNAFTVSLSNWCPYLDSNQELFFRREL